MNESATCREYVRPRLEAAGWDDDKHPIIEQKSFTDGRIVPISRDKIKRRPQKRADYLLHYTRDYTIAVVEAKAEYKLPGDGLQQAKDYAEILGVKFAYATNGHGIVEYDYFLGLTFYVVLRLLERFLANKRLFWLSETARRVRV